MEKKEFLRRLTVMYPASFYEVTEKNGYRQRTPKQNALNLYQESLNGTPENFEKLYKILLEKHENAAYVPSAPWLVQQMKQIQYVPPQIQKFDKTQLAPPPARFYEELEKLKQAAMRKKAQEALQQG